MNQLCVDIYPLFFWISFPFKSPQNTEQSSVPLLYRRFSLVIYFIHSIISVYTSILISQFIPLHLFPLGIRTLSSMSVSLFLLCKYDHLYHFSRLHIYALIYDICFSLSELLQSVWHSLGPSMSTRFNFPHLVSWRGINCKCLYSFSNGIISFIGFPTSLFCINSQQAINSLTEVFMVQKKVFSIQVYQKSELGTRAMREALCVSSS